MLAVLDLECSSEAKQSVRNARLGKIEVPIERPKRERKGDYRRRKNQESKQQTPPPPYLDRIVTTGHMPTTTQEDWRRLLIQPVSIPALAHTGLSSAFSIIEDEPLIRPDGSRSKQLSNVVKTSVHSCNRLRPHEENYIPGGVKSRQRGLPRELEAIESSCGTVVVPRHLSHSKKHNKKRGNREHAHAKASISISSNNVYAQEGSGVNDGDNGSVGDEHSGLEGDAQSAVMSTLRNHTMRARARAETSEEARARRKNELLRHADASQQVEQNMPATLPSKALNALGPEPDAVGTGEVAAYNLYEKKRKTKVKKVVAARSSTRMLLESMLDSVYGKTS